MLPFSMILSDLDTDFKVILCFNVQYLHNSPDWDEPVQILTSNGYLFHMTLK